MLEEGDHAVVIEVTRNVIARVQDRPGGFGGAVMSALESLLQRMIDGDVSHASEEECEKTATALLPVLQLAFRALREKGKGNIATQLLGFGAGDEERALRIAEEAGLP